jgi:diaminopimelate decarboxylase
VSSTISVPSFGQSLPSIQTNSGSIPDASSDASALRSSWLADVDLRRIAQVVGTPVFIYSEAQLARNVERIHDAAAAVGLRERVRLYIPFFPNSNPHLLRGLQDLGVGVLLQVPGEHEVLRRFGFEDFIVSPGHVSDEEIAFWAQHPYPTFLSSLDEVGYALRAGARSISARIDSLDSGKPGIKGSQLADLARMLHEHDRHLDSFEVYCGSGNSRDDMIEAMRTLFAMFTEHFPHARSVNFAGGHGFSYEAWDEADKHFDWLTYFHSLRQLANEMAIPEHVQFLFEPARDVLADVGALLLGVKRDPITTPVSSLVATDGSRMLMPSAQLRDRRHNVAFLDSTMTELPTPDGPDCRRALLRGRSILRHDYILPGDYAVPAELRAGGHAVILDVGAYCATQHMEFLNIPPAAEVVVDRSGAAQLVTARGDDLDKWRHLLPARRPL